MSRLGPIRPSFVLFLTMLVICTSASKISTAENSNNDHKLSTMTSSNDARWSKLETELVFVRRRRRRQLNEDSMQKYRLQLLRLCIKHGFMCDELEGVAPVGYVYPYDNYN